MNVQRIRETLDSAQGKWEAEKAAFKQGFDANPAYQLEWRTAPLLLAQARYEVALNLNDGDDDTLESNCHDFMDSQLNRIGMLMRVESRSTSAMSNLWEDAKAAAVLETIELIVRNQD